MPKYRQISSSIRALRNPKNYLAKIINFDSRVVTVVAGQILLNKWQISVKKEVQASDVVVFPNTGNMPKEVTKLKTT